MEFIKIDNDILTTIEDKLTEYDNNFIKYSNENKISIGIIDNGEIVGALDGQMTTFDIFYISTIFVDEKYRNKGIGTQLVLYAEKECKKFGAKIIRLDSFSWQGVGFYERLGFSVAGNYKLLGTEYEEYFYYKYI
ncbi:GNAT family N-acetyltransferase [Macrococcus animalis]|uniref:GNAT family N-acetyltransferase n=1 Tax=Macrococcus animalis TaxID=3395467 RepID=UPI0039BE901A